MYADVKIRRKTVSDILKLKAVRPIVSLTAYTAPTANWMDEHVDIILVGDSLGMVLYGLDSTIGVTLDMMIAHTQAVMRGASKAMVVLDMPFGSYEKSPEQAFENSSRAMIETGCSAIKMEGGAELAPTIKFLVDRNIPVMAHIGLRPQAVNVMGGYKTQGRNKSDWDAHLEDAMAISQAGAFSVVVEGTSEELGAAITKHISGTKTSTIGIGASHQCDGQVLVSEDMLGLFPKNAKFVKRYAEIGLDMEKAFKEYSEEVKARSFPSDAYVYGMKE
jgi:3-methyl-2-oxobutanoate hydroxymethyltransferase